MTRQLQTTRQLQKSLTRQLSVTRNAQRQKSLTDQLSATKTAQKSLTAQLSRSKTLQQNITKQINKLRPRGRPGRPRDPRRPKQPRVAPILIAKKKKKRVIALKATKEKKFQVFVRKKGQDVLFKSFKTKRKARTQLKKHLSVTLRASGFIFDKKKGTKIKPRLSKGFRLGKKDKFRLVEKRGRRLDTGREVRKIQAAKRAAKPFKPIKSNMGTKSKRRKTNGKK